jgi:hypothetical protein
MAQTQNTSRPLSAPLPVITPSTTKGLFRRIWDFFFGSPTPTKISGELEDAAESLVKRARMGDQNAVAMIARVRENRLSVSAAAKSYKLIEAYIARHPTGGSDTRIRVTQMNGDPRMTRTQGIIKRLALMQRGSRVSDYDPMVGWELGE